MVGMGLEGVKNITRPWLKWGTEVKQVGGSEWVNYINSGAFPKNPPKSSKSEHLKKLNLIVD